MDLCICQVNNSKPVLFGYRGVSGTKLLRADPFWPTKGPNIGQRQAMSSKMDSTRGEHIAQGTHKTFTQVHRKPVGNLSGRKVYSLAPGIILIPIFWG